MAMRCDAQQLLGELTAAGIAPGRVDTVRSGGPLDTLVWTSPPSAIELQRAQQVMAAHDPERGARERREAVARLRAGLAAWDGATTEQRLATAKDLLASTLRREPVG